MKITILDVYADCARTLPCLARRAGHPVLGTDHAIRAPHPGCVERDPFEACLGQQAENVLAVARGKPIDVVNPKPQAT